MATAPQTAINMPQETANPYANPDTAAVYDQMRQSVSPKEFSDEVLAGASQVDPQEVAKFKAELDQLDVPMEVLDMLNNMVDEVLANPDNYAQVKQKYEAMGVTEDLLPPEFDGHFFSALNMAVDQMIAEPAGEQAFAKGGIAELTPISKAVADYGRNGDTMLAHITPAEARMLRRRGGAGTTNPKTGLKEYFSLGKLFKGIGNAIKSFASSTVGKIVTTVALGFFLGPAAASLVGATSAAGVAAVSGFVGSAGSTLLGGGNLKDALKAGAIGGLTAGAISGATQGFDTAYTGPTTVGGQVDKFTGMLKSPSFPQYTAQGALTDNATSNAAREAYAGELYKTNPEAFYNPIQAPSISATGEVAGMAPTQPYPAIRPDEFGIDAQTYANTPAIDNRQFIETPPNANEQVFTPKKVSLVPDGQGGLQVPPGSEVRPFTDASGRATSMGTFPTNPPADATQFPGSFDKTGIAGPTDTSSFMDKAKTFYNENISPSGIEQRGVPAAQEAGAKAVTDLTARIPDATAAMKEAAYQNAYKATMPGVLSTYGPMAAAGIGALALGGGFKPTSAAPSTLRPELMKPVTQRIAEGGNQRNYYIQGLPGVQYDQYGAPIFGKNNPLPTFETGLGITSLINPRGYAAGGTVADLYQGVLQRTGDPEGLAYWQKRFGDEISDEEKAIFTAAAAGELAARPATAATAATTAAAAAADAEKAAAQAANRKAVADAKAAQKAAGFGNAYQNINAGLSYDTAAGYAAPSIAARQTAFAPKLGGLQNSMMGNSLTLATPQTQAYLSQNPDVMQAFKASNSGMSPDQFAQSHYQSSGKTEGRIMPVSKPVTQPYNTSAAYSSIVDPKTGSPITLAPNSSSSLQTTNTTGFDPTQIRMAELLDEAANAGLTNTSPNTTITAGYANNRPTAQTKLLNMGGIASLGSGGYPRRTGQISGPGTATSDSIPAMLSDGEFVMTAKAVRGAGKGDKRAGAKRMYALMNQLEKNAARG